MQVIKWVMGHFPDPWMTFKLNFDFVALMLREPYIYGLKQV